jgi:hypothetical protein
MIIKQMESEFGNKAPLSITRGKVHDYLGMRIDYTREGKVHHNDTVYPKHD